VPSRIRQGLNVESGLNDGLCVPLLLIALAFASAEGGSDTEPVRLVLEEIGFGVVGGLFAGALGATTLKFGRGRGWIADTWAPLLPLAATGVAYGLATVLNGSGLIAAFTAGVTFGAMTTAREAEAAEMIETVGDGFSAATFFVFGAAILPVVFEGISLAMVLFVVLALTVARMLPVAISLIGTHARLPTVAFVGWFGPRGLASIVFAVLILEAEPIPNIGVVLATISLTVVVSVYAHGVTALPLTERYVKWVRGNPRPETHAVAADS
jgi:NhaP-type Na+/H+ or K+/H+ antiporter